MYRTKLSVHTGFTILDRRPEEHKSLRVECWSRGALRGPRDALVKVAPYVGDVPSPDDRQLLF